MRCNTNGILFLLGFVFVTLTFAGSIQAQTITLSSDDDQIYRFLRSKGYTNPKVKSRTLTIIRTEACKGTEKYLVKISILGHITSTQKIGTCAPARAGFTSREAVTVLQQTGYSNIDARQIGNRVVATACQRSQRYQIEFNRRGRITNRQQVGQCGQKGLTSEQIEQVLRRDGYRRIVITDDQLPRYVAEACRNNNRMRIELNRRGNIRSERRIGECGQQFDPDNIKSLLERRGYDRVRVIDRRRPPYIAQGCRDGDRMEVEIGRYGRLRNEQRLSACRTVISPNQLVGLVEKNGYDRVRVLRGKRAPYLVEACKANALMELTIGRFGRITREERVGRCANPTSGESLTAKLVGQGYLNVSVKRRGGGWEATVCRGETKQSIRMDAFGDVIRERNIGQCPSKSVLDILKTLEGRGANSTRIFVEGCYRGKKYNWSFDRLGNRTGRTSTGSC